MGNLKHQISRPVMRYHGGKFRISEWVQSFFPAHKVYCEPFGGAASVLMTKNPSSREIYNDLDSEITNVFEVIRDSPEELARLIHYTPYSRDEWLKSYEQTDDKIELARRTIFRSWSSFGSGGATKGTSGFRSYAKFGGDYAAKTWGSFGEEIEVFTDRLKNVVIENKCGIEVMKDHDSPETLFFVDPPYLHDTRCMRSGNKYYRHEMNDSQHQDLVSFVSGVSGFVILAGYESDMYNQLLGAGWEKRKKKARAQGFRGTTARTECVWLNPLLVSHVKQGELF